MPKIQKQFHLELTVEQFLNACSLLELREIDLLIGDYLKRAEHAELRKAYRSGSEAGSEYRTQVDEQRVMIYSSEKDEKIEPFTNEFDPTPKPILGWKVPGEKATYIKSSVPCDAPPGKLSDLLDSNGT